jgi:hypothetical protein
MRHGHWLFDAETEEAIASAQALAVTFDLVKRRAIAIPEEARSLNQALTKPDLDQM